MAIYKYGTFTTGTTAQTQLALGFIPSVFRLRDETLFASGNGASETMTGLIEAYWNDALGDLSTPYTMTATYTDGAPVWSRLASGSTTTATGIVPYTTADSALFLPNQAPYKNIATTRQYIGQSTLQVIDNGASAITQAANALVTCSEAHSFTTAADVGVTVVTFHGVPGMTQINGLSGVIQSVPNTTTFTVNINTSNFSAYTNGLTEGISSGFFNVITGAPANSLYGNVSLPTAEANLGTTGLIIGTTILGGANVLTTDVWSYEAILQSPVTGP